MTKQLLNKENLENLVEKLSKVPIENWKKSTDEYIYEPHPDSPCAGYQSNYVYYKTFLKDFKIILRFESCNNIGLTFDYTLQVLKNKSGKFLDEKTESRYERGKITKLFEKIDRKYAKYQEQKEKNEEKSILAEFEKEIT